MLWYVAHGGRFGRAEQLLGVVAFSSVLAALIQQTVAWPARRKAEGNAHPQALQTAVKAERLAAFLLAIAIAGVVVVPYLY